MTDKKDDNAVIFVVLQKLTQEQIPRMQRMLEKLNAGEKLSDYEFLNLKRVYQNSMKDFRRVERNPEYKDLAMRYV